ncbi:MAG: nitroreductase [Methanomassiliicoccales archaeon]|nr:nitroreductase [Methanomassiliicoccales archaeon]NYT14772.1 nitroreductase [Methanomassiliicoccales archaeon]
MDVERAIETRRARRSLDGGSIDSNSIESLMKALRLSASCFNNQPWRVLLVDEEEPLEKVRGALSRGNLWATRAPLIMVITANPEDDCRLSDRRNYFLFDCGLAVGQMLLAATEMGIIAHPIAGYKPEIIREALSIPDEYVIIALVICGYPSDDTSLLSEKQLISEEVRPERKPFSEIFFHGEWENPLRL